MASYSNNLNLLMKDPLTEGNDTFNIETMLNENWRKIDAIGNPAELWVWEKKTPATYELGEALGKKILWMSPGIGAKYYVRFQVLDAVSFLPDGDVKIYRQDDETGADYSGIIGKFFKFSATFSGVSSGFPDGEIYYCPNNAVFDTVYSKASWNYVYVTGVKKVDIVAQTHVSYLVSSTSTTYPEDGRQGDYWYTRMGQIGDGMTRVETGSYVGTGTYGQDNPNSLTFSFKPKLVIVQNKLHPIYRILAIRDAPFTFGLSTTSTSEYTIHFIWNEVTISWYSFDSEAAQMNIKDNEYQYIAIG